MVARDAENPALRVKFWGVRGSIPCPGSETLAYGGNTACVEVRCGERLIVLDAGSGLRSLGRHLMGQPGPLDLDLLLSHCHLDHVMGLPFFAPAFSRMTTMRLWAGHLRPDETLKVMLGMLMIDPLLPITPDTFRAGIAYRDFQAADTLDLGDGITVETAVLNHPGGATGYRIAYGGRAMCYITDNEHLPNGPDPALIRLARGADLLIYDAMYTPEAYVACAGWGHSHWKEGARLADAAGARTLALFHHNPDADDAALDRTAAEAGQARPGTIMAREGLSLTFP